MKNTIRALSAIIFVTVIAPSHVLAYGENARSYRDITLTPDVAKSSLNAPSAEGVMRADADEIATLLKVRALADTIRSAKGSGGNLSHSVQQARLLCLYKLMIASEEVRKSIQAIDYEVAVANNSLNGLNAKRAMTGNMLNTANFAQGGSMGTIKQSLAFMGGAPAAARQEIAMASFGTSIALSLINLLQAGAWHRGIDSPPNSLAQIFDDRRQPADASQSYLWKFLNSPIPGSSDRLTRRAILVKHFESAVGLDSEDVVSRKRIAALPASEKELNESIKILNKRITLLHDLKTHVEEFDGSLFEFHKAIEID